MDTPIPSPVVPPQRTRALGRARSWVSGDAAALLLVLGVSAVLRLSFLGVRDVFRDEAASWVLAAYPWGDIVPRMASETYPPLYFYVLKGWMALFGDGLTALRALSALVGIATVVITYRWAREGLGRTPAVIAGLIVCFSALALDEARNVRMYALETLFVTAAWWLLWRGLRMPARRRRRVLDSCLLAVAVAGELWTMPTGIIALALQAGLVVVVWWQERRRIGWGEHIRPLRTRLASAGVALAVGAALFLPWLPAQLGAVSHPIATWPQAPSVESLSRAFGALFVGTVESPGAIYAGPVVLLVAAIGLVSAWSGGDERRALSAACLLGGIGLVASWWAISFVRSVFDARYLGAALPPLAIAAAAGATWLWKSPLRVRHPLASGAVAAAMLLVLATGPVASGSTWLSNAHLAALGMISADLERDVRPGDVILAVDARSYFPLVYELRETPNLADRLWYWHRIREPAYFGGHLIEPARTIEEATGAESFSVPGLAPGGSIWVAALTNGQWELRAFTPLTDGLVAVQEQQALKADDPPVVLYRLGLVLPASSP